MAVAWESLFDNYGIKKVTPTDKSKTAYVPNVAQCSAVAAAGIRPATDRPGDPIDVSVLFDDSRNVVVSSFYHAGRDVTKRTPEPRMGQDLITLWMKVNDEVLIGNIGTQLFVFRLSDVPASDEDIIRGIAQHCTRENLFSEAKKAKGRPAKRTITREDFVRNPFVVVAALARANGKCERQACRSPLFEKTDGTIFLEVHHIVALSEGGEDSLENAAAVCPNCHRELHHGKDRHILRASMQRLIKGKVFV